MSRAAPKRRAPTTEFDLRRLGPRGRPRYATNARYVEAVKRALPGPIESLFRRCPALTGFAVRGLDEVPDSCSRSGDEAELFISDIGVAPGLDAEQYGEIFQEIAVTLSDFLAEEPGAGELLRGRTFARTLH